MLFISTFQSVERRRRDKINNWIVTLSKIIPDCSMDSTKTGAVSTCLCSAANFYFFLLTVAIQLCDGISVLPEQRRHPVQSLWLHPRAQAKQPATAGEFERSGEDTSGQWIVQAAGMNISCCREPTNIGINWSFRGGEIMGKEGLWMIMSKSSFEVVGCSINKVTYNEEAIVGCICVYEDCDGVE